MRCDSSASSWIYRKVRDQSLRAENIQPPSTQISGIPLDSDTRASKLAVISLGLGSGSFGSVYGVFDPICGDLRAVKQFEIKTQGAERSL